MLIIGITIIVTIAFSNSSLNASKSPFIKNGNLADLTVSIPDAIRQKSIDDQNKENEENNQNKPNGTQDSDPGDVKSRPGFTKVDKELQTKLDKLGLSYSLTQTFNAFDILTGNSFVAINSTNDFSLNEE